MKIYVARHGETNYNVLGLHNVDPKVDVHLTEKGVADAELLSEHLKDVNIDTIYISELPRMAQTAEIVNQNHAAQIIIDHRLIDVDSGFEGRKVSDYHELRDNSENPFTFKVPGHESSEDVYKRTVDFLSSLKTKGHQNVLIITSAHNFRHFKSALDGLVPGANLKEHIPNGEMLVREI